MDASQVREIAKLPEIDRPDDRLARYGHEQKAANDTDSQAIVNKRMFSDEDLIDYAGLPADSALFDKNASVRRRDGRPLHVPPPIGTPPARGSYFFGESEKKASLLPSIMTADPQVPPLPAEKREGRGVGSILCSLLQINSPVRRARAASRASPTWSVRRRPTSRAPAARPRCAATRT